MKRFIQKIMSFIPGWIKDVNYTTNPGYIKLKNGKVNDLGKIAKRTGWETKLRYTQDQTSPGQEGNLPLVFNYPVSGVSSCVRPQVIHVHSKTASTGEVKKYILAHYRYQNTNVLNKYRFNTAGSQDAAAIQVGSSAQFKNYGPVKFIETNDQTYIINSFQKLVGGRKQGYLWKYAYGENINQYDTDRIHNAVVYSNMVGRASVIKVPTIIGSPTAPTGYIANTGFGAAEEGKYQYLIMPVYNTGTVGRYDKNAINLPIDVTISLTQNEKQSKNVAQVVLEVFSNYDPYIVAYQIFRTKKNETVSANGAYFVCQITKPANDINPGVWQILKNSDSLNNSTDINQSLGSSLSQVPYLNTYIAPLQLQTNAIGDNLLNFPIDCGTFADQRLILGYGNRLYFSLLDKTDAIDGTLTLLMPLAHETENPVTAIESVGPWTFAFCKSCIYKLMPTSNTLAPYQLTLASNSFGVDSLAGITVLDNIAYFMFKNQLHAMNAYGQIKPIGGPLNSIFAESVDFISVTKNEKEKFIKILFRTATGAREVDFWPDKNQYIENSGYRDIFNPISANEVELLAKNDRVKLLAYEYNNATGEEWGITADGDIVSRGTEFKDKSQASAVNTWQDYTYAGAVAASNDYPVELEFIKAFSYDERVQFNSALFYGSGNIWVSYALEDSETYSTERYVELARDGVEVVIDEQAFSCKLRVRHDDPSDIDLDYFAMKITASGKVDFLNSTENGD